MIQKLNDKIEITLIQAEIENEKIKEIPLQYNSYSSHNTNNTFSNTFLGYYLNKALKNLYTF
jgi:hypothetical protein